MIITVTGGSASGKSNIAEEMICRLSNGEPKHYIATMYVGIDEENMERVAKHREQRKDKGFETVECPRNLKDCVADLSHKNALLECVSNLTANEMFFGEEIRSIETTVSSVIEGIKALADASDNLVIVSNNIFEAGSEYDETTRSYMEALGEINRVIFELSDEVYEAVVGISVRIK